MHSNKSLKRILIILLLICFAVFALIYLAIRDIRLKNENISSISQELLTKTDKQEYLLTTERLIENISSDLKKVDSYIVARDGDVGFIEELESLARENGLTISIDSLSVEDSKDLEASGVTTLKIRAKTKGRWSGTYTLLSQLESLPYRISVNNFSAVDTTDIPVGGKRPTTPSSNWQSSFEIQVLKYK